MTGTRKPKRCPATYTQPPTQQWLGIPFDCPVCGQLARVNQAGTIAPHFLPLDVA